MEKQIMTLSDMRGISGYEYRINEKIREMFMPYSDDVRIDSLGNVIAYKKGKKGNFKIMLEAHCDEIGLMVTNIDERGFLSFCSVGGVDERILPSAEVIVHAKKDIKGVIGVKPPHILTKEESEKSIKIKDMAIDTGLCYDEVKELVDIGDSVTLSQSFGKLLGDTFSAKTLDDRVGVSALLEVFKRIGKIDADLYASVCVQEEIGLRGAKVSAYDVYPDVAIAVDVCHAITPDNSKDAFEAGSGAVITIGPNIHKKVADKLFEISKKYDLNTNTEVEAGHTGTDAWAIQVTKSGIPTGLVSIPLKYMHTSVETMDMKDYETVVSLLEHFVNDSLEYEEGWLCF